MSYNPELAYEFPPFEVPAANFKYGRKIRNALKQAPLVKDEFGNEAADAEITQFSHLSDTGWIIIAGLRKQKNEVSVRKPRAFRLLIEEAFEIIRLEPNGPQVSNDEQAQDI